MVNLVQAWTEHFMEKNPSTFIAVTGGGSGTGFASLINGSTDIAMASREIKTQEKETALAKGLQPKEFKTALDGLAVVVNWGAGSDTQTSASLLQYVVKVGTTSGGNNIASGRVASPNFFLRQMANGAQKLTFPLKNLPCSQTYYWSVATVDTGYRGATGFSSEHNFTLSPSCTVSEGTSSDSGGGGVGWWVTSSSSSSSRQSVAEDPTYGFLNVTAFRDPNNDGSQGLREPSAFGGLPVTVAGTSIDGDPVKVTQNLNAAGMLSLTVPPSDTTGYTVSIDTTGKNMDDFTPSSSLTKTAIVITKNETENIDFGFHRTALLGYKPCLSITDTAVKDSIPPAAQFLGLLKLANNKGVMDGTGILSIRISLTRAT
jgi:hypothetical protein